MELQKEIWLKHIEVQEKVLQSNSASIVIDSNNIRLSGQRLRLMASQTDDLDKLLNRIKSFFHITDNEIDPENDILICDSHFEPDQRGISLLSNDCLKYHIHFSTKPIIEGIIRSQKSTFTQCTKLLKDWKEIYSIDSNRRLQISIEALHRLAEEPSLPKGILPDKASGIFGVSPTPVYFLKKWYSINCSHVLNYVNFTIEGQEVRRLHRLICLNDVFFSESALQKLNEVWGLKLQSYDVEVKVKKKLLKKYDFRKSIYDFPELENDVFRYHFSVSNSGNLLNSSIVNKKWQIDLLDSIYKTEFGENNYELNIKYLYQYDMKLYGQFIEGINSSEFFQYLRNNIDDDNISISEDIQSIGVDFEWRKTNPDELRIELSNRYEFLEVSVYDDHRCKVNIIDKNAEWDKIEDFLKKNYSSLKTYIGRKDEYMHFYQEYNTLEQASQFRFSLSSSSDDLKDMGCECEVHSDIIGKKKYFLRIDYDKIAEDKELVLNTLRGAEFSVGNHSIGKLIKINYPELVFDISSADYGFLTEGSLHFNTIKPNLEGDMEKIKRLKDAFDGITSGNGIKNPNLSKFIFDASKAEPTEDIDYYTNVASDYYKDIINNLLNKHINPSQLNAIIKCLKAKDISLIQGPPGTGKSTAIAELIWQHIRLNPKERILLTSETNLAVDNAIDRTVNDTHNLVKPIRFGTDDRLAVEGRQFSLKAMEQWVETGKYEFKEETEDTQDDEETTVKTGKMILVNWLKNIKKRINYDRMDSKSSAIWENFLDNPDKSFREIIYEQYKSHCNVVGATCSSIGEKNTKNRPTKFFESYCTLFGEVTKKIICKKTDDYFDDYEGLYCPNYEEKEVIDYKCEDGISFSTVIQDESSKATPAELALPLIYGQKNIVIGDHRQLPPMLDQEEFLNTIDYLIDNSSGASELKQLKKLKHYVLKNFDQLEISHFQTLYENIDESLKGEFTLQYRMHPDINEVIKQFYENEKGLECGLIKPIDLGVNDVNMSNPFSRYHGIAIDDFICGESLTPENHVVWIDVNSPEMLDGTSRINEGELEVIYHILEKFSLSDSFQNYCNKWTNEEDKEIGIISFYSKQRNRIRRMCKSLNDLSLKIDVVDRFQGMERNIIIVSMVRSNTIVSDSQQKPDYSEYPLGYPEQEDLGFAQSPNRLNVALSRAKRLLIIIGNSMLFRQKDIYNNVYNIIDANPNGKIIKCNPYEDLRKDNIRI